MRDTVSIERTGNLFVTVSRRILGGPRRFLYRHIKISVYPNHTLVFVVVVVVFFSRKT